MNEPLQTLRLQGSRKKTITAFLICLIFFALSYWTYAVGGIRSNEFWLWLSYTSFFGLCTLVGLYALYKGYPYLLLNEFGFVEARDGVHSARWGWEDIHDFYVATYRHNKFAVCYSFNWIDENLSEEALAQSTPDDNGYDELLSTYGMSAEALADFLNDYREKALAAK